MEGGLEQENLAALVAVEAAGARRQLGAGPSAIADCAVRIADDPTHHSILALVAAGAPADSRAIARSLGIPVDDANVAIQRLLTLELFAMDGPRAWKDALELGAEPADAFVQAVWRRAAQAIAAADSPAPALAHDPKEDAVAGPVTQFQILARDPRPQRVSIDRSSDGPSTRRTRSDTVRSPRARTGFAEGSGLCRRMRNRSCSCSSRSTT